ncbi:hypothetical protein BX616_007981, partial [Lobosporangium transversale]
VILTNIIVVDEVLTSPATSLKKLQRQQQLPVVMATMTRGLLLAFPLSIRKLPPWTLLSALTKKLK